jgi:hypothetical protein
MTGRYHPPDSNNDPRYQHQQYFPWSRDDTIPYPPPSEQSHRRISPIPSNYPSSSLPNYYPQQQQLPQQFLEEELRYSSSSLPPSSESQNSRHARRLYVGGIPPGHTNEEQLKFYLNEVIHKCLNEQDTTPISSSSPSPAAAPPPSFILSIYMNHKKCFAFIELVSIELATCCLELDGIIYLSSILKIQRANEYKPELVANVPRAPLRFNASRAPFPHTPGVAVGVSSGGGMESGLGSSSSSVTGGGHHQQHQHQQSSSSSSHMMLSHPSSHCIRMCSMMDVTPGSVVLIGFPHDEGAKRSGIPAGSATGPAAIRFYLRKLLASTTNPEFGIDLSRLQILDVGDVPLGLTLEDALSRLDDSIIDVIQRGGLPIVLGGSGDLAYACASGLMTACGVPIAVVDINSSLNMDPLVPSLPLLLTSPHLTPPPLSLLSHPTENRTKSRSGLHQPFASQRRQILSAQRHECQWDWLLRAAL